MPNIKRSLQTAISSLASRLREQLNTQAMLRSAYEQTKLGVQAITPDNPAVHGYKIYSQCDEDGIIENIFSRIGDGNRIFFEIGCSDGLENNTHTLALKGWKGLWVDADSKKIKFINREIPKTDRLIVIREFVTISNIRQIVKHALDRLQVDIIDFFSLDVDSQDLHIIAALLQINKPRVICVEYNAKFHPPLRICVNSDNATWSGDDYQGASLCSFVDLLNDAGYVLVACNLSGVNAFFVRSEYATKFATAGTDLLYQPSRYHLIRLSSGHRASLKFLKDVLTREK